MLGLVDRERGAWIGRGSWHVVRDRDNRRNHPGRAAGARRRGRARPRRGEFDQPPLRHGETEPATTGVPRTARSPSAPLGQVGAGSTSPSAPAAPSSRPPSSASRSSCDRAPATTCSCSHCRGTRSENASSRPSTATRPRVVPGSVLDVSPGWPESRSCIDIRPLEVIGFAYACWRTRYRTDRPATPGSSGTGGTRLFESRASSSWRPTRSSSIVKTTASSSNPFPGRPTLATVLSRLDAAR